MDNNNFQENNKSNPFHLSENETATETNQGLDPQTFGTTGTYNAQNYGTVNNGSVTQPAYTAGGGEQASPFEDAYAKKAKTGLIIGIVSMVLNLIFCCIPFVTDWVFSPGWIFIFLEIAGIQNANQGRQSASKKGMATTGMVLNIVSLVWSILLVILVLVLKFSDVLS